MSARPEVTLKTNSYEIKLKFDLNPTVNKGYVQI